jgi:tetratricopeptide (TPR) repeat protein
MTVKFCTSILSALSIALLTGCATHATSYVHTIDKAAQYQNQRDFVLAERYHRMALEQMRAESGVSANNLAIQLANLASALNHIRRPDEAETHLREALELQAKQPNPNQSVLAHIYANLGRAEELQGDLESAEHAYTKSMDLAFHYDKWSPSDFGFLMAGLANIYVQRDQLDKADQFHRKARELYEASLGRNSIAWSDRAVEYSKLREAAAIRRAEAQ